MKKMLVFAALLVAVLSSLSFVNFPQNEIKTKDSPFGDKKLDQSTIKQLDDPNYRNQIMPYQLKQDTRIPWT